VARYQGGHNAGHSVQIGDRSFVLHFVSLLRSYGALDQYRCWSYKHLAPTEPRTENLSPQSHIYAAL
jgi:hypothetical protein